MRELLKESKETKNNTDITTGVEYKSNRKMKVPANA